jgi:hypothetical protein
MRKKEEVGEKERERERDKEKDGVKERVGGERDKKIKKERKIER